MPCLGAAAVASVQLPRPHPASRLSRGASPPSPFPFLHVGPQDTARVPAAAVCSPSQSSAIGVSAEVLRRNVLSTLLSTSAVLFFGPNRIILADTTGGAFREYIDTFDGYSFLYPKGWIQVRGAGADIFFRDPVLLDVNMSVDISSPSSSNYKTVEDLGPPENAAKGVLKQYLTEFMSTRLGVRRESNVLSASSKVSDDGKLYYEVEVNIKSYASNNELAVMPADRVQRLEWDRRYLTVLGVENNRLYALRLQSPERLLLEEEGDLRRVMDSFRVNKIEA
ncbi:hypothetical protein QYE76_016211 [Lolium multiflorum]|uniref:PsbP C-terminal domain-containing protein n=1 Tax=Lolium multiflorum TaxID=4521 RepID=A0AAD8XAI4_LOLMU|nr:hypothetical protein QYE76_016211 [Lolium multiflorum]